MQTALLGEARSKFLQGFGRLPSVTAYAPGRVEILGNHTDYNEGFVLSAAIDSGNLFLAVPREDDRVRLSAAGKGRVEFPLAEMNQPGKDTWVNYVRGVLSGLAKLGPIAKGFDALIHGDVPLGAGLSSSAALEMSAGLALARLYNLQPEPVALAKIGQAAEHDFVGVQCGLLDQITSLLGMENSLLLSDFRQLTFESVPLGAEACFLVCNTHVKHALVDGEYNIRRAKCEEAARFFAGVLKHPVAALRDVSWEEWNAWRAQMDPVAAQRAAHVIGENTRVLQARKLLAAGDLEGFGRLMFESHESSIHHFENSCPELDAMVAVARDTPGVLGARLSGGGFGGSMVALVRAADAGRVKTAIQVGYNARFRPPCDVLTVRPSGGARVL